MCVCARVCVFVCVCVCLCVCMCMYRMHFAPVTVVELPYDVSLHSSTGKEFALKIIDKAKCAGKVSWFTPPIDEH